MAAVTEAEPAKICRRIADNKAPGLDAIPSIALIIAVKTALTTLSANLRLVW